VVLNGYLLLVAHAGIVEAEVDRAAVVRVRCKMLRCLIELRLVP
jgi:hypothetical protein